MPTHRRQYDKNDFTLSQIADVTARRKHRDDSLEKYRAQYSEKIGMMSSTANETAAAAGEDSDEELSIIQPSGAAGGLGGGRDFEHHLAVNKIDSANVTLRRQ